MTPDEELRRGAEARNILSNGIYKEAYNAVRERIVSQLCLADTPDDRRKRLNDLLIALTTVQRHMEQVMVTGTMAADEIERKQTWAERMRARVA